MAKRSPILGYNHNVKYRGLVFHVQTEDSGLLNPHLFTHLFHGGVIVSTRKLVYDAGANEEAIKALMQAQHKAVMKDLRKGSFDDKIDQYLGGTEGLEPAQGKASRAPTEIDPPAAAEDRPSEPSMPLELEPPPPPEILAAPTEHTPPPPEASSAVPELDIGPPESVPILLTAQKPRTQTHDRNALPSVRFKGEPPPPRPDAPTESDSIAAAIQAANASAQKRGPAPQAPKGPLPPHARVQDYRMESSPEIEISAGDESSRTRAPHDTAVEPEITLPPPRAARAPTGGDRPASHVGATLPAAPRPPSRPSFTPPAVISRPIAASAERSEAVEIHSPAAASAQAPPGERGERAGQYSLGRGKNPSENVQMKERTGRIPVLTPPVGERTSGSGSMPAVRPNLPPVSRQTPAAGGSTAKPPTPPAKPAEPAATSSQAIPRIQTPAAAAPVAPQPSRTVTPPRVTAPRAAQNPGVVMTRPAVIVGAPPKPAAPARVRKAREDEGRGFGQGLISEKSLDEVILAYLSEDAEEK